MSDHMDEDSRMPNTPKAENEIHMPKPDRPNPRKIMDEGRQAMTPPAAKKDERVVR